MDKTKLELQRSMPKQRTTIEPVGLNDPFLVEFSEEIPEEVESTGTRFTKVFNETTDDD